MAEDWTTPGWAFMVVHRDGAKIKIGRLTRMPVRAEISTVDTIARARAEVRIGEGRVTVLAMRASEVKDMALKSSRTVWKIDDATETPARDKGPKPPIKMRSTRDTTGSEIELRQWGG